MINRIIEREEARLRAQGYDCLVEPTEVRVTKNLEVRTLGGDLYVLTGIAPSAQGMMSDNQKVNVFSSSATLSGTMRQIAAMGQSIYRSFRNYLIIRTSDPDWDGRPETTPTYTLSFVKISPIKREKR